MLNKRFDLPRLSDTQIHYINEYMRHAALNLGQAARDLRYFINHPHADKVALPGSFRHILASLIQRLPSFVNNLYFALIPPRLHHTAEELEDINKRTAKEFFLHGYKPWDYL